MEGLAAPRPCRRQSRRNLRNRSPIAPLPALAGLRESRLSTGRTSVAAPVLLLDAGFLLRYRYVRRRHDRPARCACWFLLWKLVTFGYNCTTRTNFFRIG